MLPMRPLTPDGRRALSKASATRYMPPAKAVRTPPPAPSGNAAVAAPSQRGPRPAPDGGLRGAGGLPGPGRVAQPAAARSSPRTNVATADIVTAVESDVALIIAVLRLANQVAGPRAGAWTRSSPPSSVLSPADRAGARQPRCAHSTSSSAASVWDAAPERFRLHALATQHAADRLAAEVGYEHRDRLTVTSLLHDIGKLVLLHAYPGYPAQVHGDAQTPEERIHQERRELGVDHALVGGVLARRWGLPRAIATAIERHHNRGRRGRGRVRAPRRHARPLRAGRAGLARRRCSGARARSGSARTSCAA